MNNKIFIWIIILFGFITFVNAQNICLSPIYANTTCLMVTPTLYCDNITGYTYELYNNNGILINNGSLSLYNQVDNSYFFNFTQDIGTYYVWICDGSTRQVEVEGDNMIGFTYDTWIFVILILLFALFIWLSFKIHPIFMVLNGIIFGYFAFYSYTILNSWFVTVLMAIVGTLFIFIGIIGSLYK